MVLRAEPVRGAGAHRPAAGPRAGPRLRGGTQRTLARRAGLAGHGGGLLPGGDREGSPARRAAARRSSRPDRLAGRRRPGHAPAGRARPGGDRLPADHRRGALDGDAPRLRSARGRRHPLRDRPRHVQPDRGHRRATRPRRCSTRRRTCCTTWPARTTRWSAPSERRARSPLPTTPNQPARPGMRSFNWSGRDPDPAPRLRVRGAARVGQGCCPRARHHRASGLHAPQAAPHRARRPAVQPDAVGPGVHTRRPAPGEQGQRDPGPAEPDRHRGQ